VIHPLAHQASLPRPRRTIQGRPAPGDLSRVPGGAVLGGLRLSFTDRLRGIAMDPRGEARAGDEGSGGWRSLLHPSGLLALAGAGHLQSPRDFTDRFFRTFVVMFARVHPHREATTVVLVGRDNTADAVCTPSAVLCAPSSMTSSVVMLTVSAFRCETHLPSSMQPWPRRSNCTYMHLHTVTRSAVKIICHPVCCRGHACGTALIYCVTPRCETRLSSSMQPWPRLCV